MTQSDLWREFESGDGFLLKALRFCVIAGGVAFLVFTGILELTWPQQIIARTVDGDAGDLDGSQFQLLPGDADADARLDVLHLPVWLLADCDDVQVLS